LSNPPEEQPSGNETLIGLPGGLLHDIQIRGVEAQSGGWETISNL